MTEQKDTVELMTFDVVKFDITRAEIAEISQKGMALTIRGLDDKTGFDAVHSALMDVVHRCAFIEKQGMAYRRKALDWNKAVLAEEKELLRLFQPVRDYLIDQKQRVVEEKERIEQEAENKILAILQARCDRLSDMGCRFDRIANAYSYGTLVAPIAMIKVAPAAQWETICSTIQEAVDADKAKAAEEADRIAKIQAEQERIAAEQAKERERLAAEGKSIREAAEALAREKKAAEDAILKAEQDKLRAAELEKAKAEAAEKARIETEQRIKREAEEKIAKEKAEAEAKIAKELKAKEAAERKAARLPDKVKLQNYLVVLFGIPAPELKTPEGTEAWKQIDAALEELNIQLGQIVEAL